jgi:hypothetical protein
LKSAEVAVLQREEAVDSVALQAEEAVDTADSSDEQAPVDMVDPLEAAAVVGKAPVDTRQR